MKLPCYGRLLSSVEAERNNSKILLREIAGPRPVFKQFRGSWNCDIVSMLLGGIKVVR